MDIAIGDRVWIKGEARGPFTVIGVHDHHVHGHDLWLKHHGLMMIVHDDFVEEVVGGNQEKPGKVKAMSATEKINRHMWQMAASGRVDPERLRRIDSPDLTEMRTRDAGSQAWQTEEQTTREKESIHGLDAPT